MSYNADGTWTPEAGSVEGRVAGITSQNSPLMQQARTSAKQASNRRGLLNSTMAVQAGEASVL